MKARMTKARRLALALDQLEQLWRERAVSLRARAERTSKNGNDPVADQLRHAAADVDDCRKDLADARRRAELPS